jgi:hypothetical protein
VSRPATLQEPWHPSISDYLEESQGCSMWKEVAESPVRKVWLGQNSQVGELPHRILHSNLVQTQFKALLSVY